MFLFLVLMLVSEPAEASESRTPDETYAASEKQLEKKYKAVLELPDALYHGHAFANCTLDEVLAVMPEVLAANKYQLEAFRDAEGPRRQVPFYGYSGRGDIILLQRAHATEIRLRYASKNLPGGARQGLGNSVASQMMYRCEEGRTAANLRTPVREVDAERVEMDAIDLRYLTLSDGRVLVAQVGLGGFGLHTRLGIDTVTMESPSGQELWSVALSNGDASEFRLLSEQPLVLSIANRVVGFDAQTGTELWSRFRRDTEPVVVDDSVLMVEGEGNRRRRILVDLSGREVWSIGQKGDADRLVPLDGGAALLGDSVLQFLDVDSGEAIEELQIENIVSATSVGSRVVVADSEGVTAYDVRGRVAWNLPLHGVEGFLTDQEALFVHGEGRLTKLSVEDGREEWHVELREGPTSPLLAHGGQWYFTTRGSVVRLTPAGELHTQPRIPHPQLLPDTVAVQGNVLVVANSGVLAGYDAETLVARYEMAPVHGVDRLDPVWHAEEQLATKFVFGQSIDLAHGAASSAAAAYDSWKQLAYGTNNDMLIAQNNLTTSSAQQTFGAAAAGVSTYSSMAAAGEELSWAATEMRIRYRHGRVLDERRQWIQQGYYVRPIETLYRHGILVVRLEDGAWQEVWLGAATAPWQDVQPQMRQVRLVSDQVDTSALPADSAALRVEAEHKFRGAVRVDRLRFALPSEWQEPGQYQERAEAPASMMLEP